MGARPQTRGATGRSQPCRSPHRLLYPPPPLRLGSGVTLIRSDLETAAAGRAGAGGSRRGGGPGEGSPPRRCRGAGRGSPGSVRRWRWSTGGAERSGGERQRSGYGPGVLRRGRGEGRDGVATSRLWDPLALGPPLSGCGVP